MKAVHTGQHQAVRVGRLQPGVDLGMAAAAALPVAALAALIYIFATWGNALLGPARGPEDASAKLDVERVDFQPGQIALQVLNSGARELTVAQVMVNEALWDFSIDGEATLPHMGRATINIAYPWLAGDPCGVKIVTSDGQVFVKEGAAPTTSESNPPSFPALTLFGLGTGVVPVYLGLLLLPALGRLGRGAMGFVLALAAGLVFFLGLDALRQALELAGRAPGPYRGFGLVGIGLVGTFLALLAVGRRTIGAHFGPPVAERRLALAYLVAFGLGLLNLGVGLTIGAAYALGQLALGAFLAIVFTLHSTAQGLGIAAPVARHGARLWHLVRLGLLAGGPTILGAWVGSFVQSDAWITLFLAIGAGAAFQVVYQLARLPERALPDWLTEPANAAGLLAGAVLMYAPGLLVAA
jgi:zinc transporter, ZIP family